MAIPKKIHYCWFGRNPKPKLAEKCIRSWKRKCPDYEIIEWTEDNFDISACPLYVQQAYEAKKWAFVTDYARLAILYQHGGIYFDTDVRVIRNLDPLLSNRCFMGIEQAYTCIKVASGLGIGAEAGFPLIGEIMDDYKNASFYKEDGSIDITTCTVRNTEILKKHGYVEENRIQTVAGATIYPWEYFSPMDMNNGKIYKTKNTYTIHLYSLSWTPRDHQLEYQKTRRKYRRDDFIYNIKTLPNNLLLKLLGKDGYAQFKQRLKGGK